MKAQLRMRAHATFPGHFVYDIYWGDDKIGEVTGADEPGIRIFSHHPIHVQQDQVSGVHFTEVIIRTPHGGTVNG